MKSKIVKSRSNRPKKTGDGFTTEDEAARGGCGFNRSCDEADLPIIRVKPVEKKPIGIRHMKVMRVMNCMKPMKDMNKEAEG
jgi:hypothetical protein